MWARTGFSSKVQLRKDVGRNHFLAIPGLEVSFSHRLSTRGHPQLLHVAHSFFACGLPQQDRLLHQSSREEKVSWQDRGYSLVYCTHNCVHPVIFAIFSIARSKSRVAPTLKGRGSHKGRKHRSWGPP